MKYNINNKLAKYVAIPAIALSLGACTPKPMNLKEINEYKGSVADFSAEASARYGTLDASESAREMECFKKGNGLVGKVFDSKVELANALGDCVRDLEKSDMWKWIAYGTLADGAKVALIYLGSGGSDNGSSSTSSGNNRTRDAHSLVELVDAVDE